MTDPIDLKYGIIAIRPSESKVEGEVDILHFCGYENQPTEADFRALHEELGKDEEFGLVAQMNSIKLVEAPQEIVDLYREMLETDPKWHEAN